MAGRADLDLFTDRSRRPELIREGYERTVRALEPFRGRRRAT